MTMRRGIPLFRIALAAVGLGATLGYSIFYFLLLTTRHVGMDELWLLGCLFAIPWLGFASVVPLIHRRTAWLVISFVLLCLVLPVVTGSVAARIQLRMAENVVREVVSCVVRDDCPSRFRFHGDSDRASLKRDYTIPCTVKLRDSLFGSYEVDAHFASGVSYRFDVRRGIGDQWHVWFRKSPPRTRSGK